MSRTQKPKSRRLSFEILEDRIVPTSYTVSNNLDVGAGSLRAAITALNLTGTTSNTININNPLTGGTAILTAAALPAINRSVSIVVATGANAISLERASINRNANPGPARFSELWPVAINLQHSFGITRSVRFRQTAFRRRKYRLS